MKKRNKKLKKPSFLKEPFYKTKIKVIGIGGGGSSIVSEIAKNPDLSKRSRIDFLVANTDLQDLKKAGKKTKVFRFGQNLTDGLGCGMDFKLGERAAQNEKEKIKKILKGTDFCIFVACLGGGTGSGAGPIFTEVSQSLKNINFGFFTLPFKFEGKKRAEIAKNSLLKLKSNLNAFVVFPNEKIFKIINSKTSLKESFSALNSILAEDLKSLIEVIHQPGLINIDWADFKTILAGKQKLAYLATAQARGENRAKQALKQVLESPFYKHPVDGFLIERILFNIAGSKDLGMAEVEEISKTISNFNKRAKIVFGISQHPDLKNKIKITLLAVGQERKIKKLKKPKIKIKIKKRPVIKITENKEKEERKKPKKPKKKAKKKAKKTKIKVHSVKNSKSKEKAKKEQITKKVKGRKNALQVKKEMEKAEKEILEKEKKWDIPAFLRKKE
jgi:cell division protein FtsZ